MEAVHVIGMFTLISFLSRYFNPLPSAPRIAQGAWDGKHHLADPASICYFYWMIDVCASHILEAEASLSCPLFLHQSDVLFKTGPFRL
jgi:hypothetical protein